VSHALDRIVRLITVEGPSMRPALEPGDRLVVLPLPLRVGAVVALEHDGRVLVKRVVAVGEDGVVVHGYDAAASTDSRDFGPVPRSAILGRAIYRYAPRERAGRVPLGP
jgi:nickel-type superoxide dismutase maturation protease